MTLPDSSERDRLELVFQLALGIAVPILRGSRRTLDPQAAYERASALCDRLGDRKG